MIDTIEEFQEKTKFPLANFLVDSNQFFTSDFPHIVNFYNGNSKTLDRSHIKKLNTLSEQASYILQYFKERKQAFNTVDYWELLDMIEDIKIKFNTSKNISKYLRSSIVDGTDKAGFVYDARMSRNETLEDISFNQLQKSGENDWLDIAFENDLKEVDYDVQGGTQLKLRKQLFQSNLVTSMIDNTIGEKIYGKDIKKSFQYKDDDLETLGYKDTVYQSVEILAKLSKGDIPEYRSLGLRKNIYKGSNFSRLNYSSIVREMNKNFASDDLFTDFVVKELRYEQGDVYIEYQVNTKYDLVVIKNIYL